MQVDPQNIKGLLIDMDGTLVDHSQTLTRCFQYACRGLGFPEPSQETVKRSIGGSMPVTIQKFLPASHVEAGKELWRQRFEEIHLQGVRLLPGADDLLEACVSKNVKRAIFTNKTGRHTRAIIENEGLDHYFTFVLGAEDSPYRKPEAEFSAMALEKIDLPPENVLMVGDSPFDIEAGTAGGFQTLCVPTGSHTKAELEAAGAYRVFQSLASIADWLRGY